MVSAPCVVLYRVSVFSSHGVDISEQVINFYFQMMSDRDEALVNAGVLPKRSHFFNSFFVTKVSENGYNFVNVRRWTRKVGLHVNEWAVSHMGDDVFAARLDVD